MGEAEGPAADLISLRWARLQWRLRNPTRLRPAKRSGWGVGLEGAPGSKMEMKVQENEANRNQDLSLGLSTLCLLLFTNFISWQQSLESEN